MGVWIIKHVISPLDRQLYQRTGGQRVALGKPLGPLLLLTTTGRRTGKEHTTPAGWQPARALQCQPWL
jgi:F420H(2)-dependent quinone reductase